MKRNAFELLAIAAKKKSARERRYKKFSPKKRTPHLDREGLKLDTHCTFLATMRVFTFNLTYCSCIRQKLIFEADLRIRDEDGMSALMCAVQGKHIECAKAILDHMVDLGHDIIEQDNKDNTILHMAARNGDLNMLKLILGGPAEVRPDHWFSDEEREEFINRLNWKLQTPMCSAMKHGHFDCMQVLGQLRAHRSLRYIFHCAPFWHAVRKRDVKAVKFLLEGDGTSITDILDWKGDQSFLFILYHVVYLLSEANVKLFYFKFRRRKSAI